MNQHGREHLTLVQVDDSDTPDRWIPARTFIRYLGLSFAAWAVISLLLLAGVFVWDWSHWLLIGVGYTAALAARSAADLVELLTEIRRSLDRSRAWGGGPW